MFQIAATELIDVLRARVDAKATSKANSIPEAVLRQMISLQSTSNEFLRHFWSSVLPPRAGDISFTAKATPVQKAARAQKMISYLEKTPDRLEQILDDASEQMQVDPERIRAVRLVSWE
jgi:transcription initiation factor TFIIH subunit 1